jgi:adenosine deaminase
MIDFIEAMPKIDLHCHLDGAVRPQTLLELAHENEISLPATTVEGMSPFLRADDNCASLAEYLRKFQIPLRCLQLSSAQTRVAREVVEDASAHHVKYVEVRFSPQSMAQGDVSAETAVTNVIEGLKQGEEETGTLARAILICMRGDPVSKNLEVVELAAQYYGRGVVGVDLAGNEADYPPSLYRDVFQLAQKRGLPITIHAGENGPADYIREAVCRLGAVRIGHGVHLRDDPEVEQLVRQRKVALEICVSSNVQTKAVQSLADHPVRQYFDHGLCVTVNTDNPTVSNTDITREFQILFQKFHFTYAEMKTLLLNAVGASFLEKEKKEALAKTVGQEWKKIL